MKSVRTEVAEDIRVMGQGNCGKRSPQVKKMGRFNRYRRLQGRRIRPDLLRTSTLPLVLAERGNNYTLPPKVTTKPERRIVIVGAGLAGCIAAWQLGRAGFHNVIVVEASNRVGGRCHSLWHESGRAIEAGGELIGIGHRLWLSLALHFRLPLVPMVEEEHYVSRGYHSPVWLNGHRLSEKELEEVEEVFQDVMKLISADARKLTHPEQPWLETAEIRALDEISIADKLTEWKITGQARELIELEFENDNVSRVEEQSYLGLLCVVKACSPHNPDLFWDEVENYRCGHGNVRLAQALIHKVAVHLNNPVVKIVWDRNTNTFEVKGMFASYFADSVILAIPPSMWNKIDFDNGYRLTEQYPLTMGPACKFFTTSQSRWWLNLGWSPNGLHSELGQLWEATEQEKETKKVTLTVFSGGPHYTSNPKILQEKVEEFFGMDLLKDDKIEHQYISWVNQPWIGCGYSYSSKGQVTKQLARFVQPLSEFGNALWIAGEHTSAGFPGFMEGALRSGLAVANMIISRCG